MLPQETIRRKRDGRALSPQEIRDFVSGVVDGRVGEGQVAAFCMAVLLKGMAADERVQLTLAMAQSGAVVDWKGENLPGPVLDKHSTGGVGDKTSLMLAPVVAACGGYVPMISGRGLGHTGGTLDKMDAVPGYVSQPDMDLFRKAVRGAGCAIIGATRDLAPADRIIYAIRDVTATVESLDLITASILSKKLAAGLEALVMDVKFGTGAFMQDYADAKALAQSIVQVANGAGLPTVALLTDMNAVLGTAAGNAIEVLEAVRFLKGEAQDVRLYEVTAALSAELLVLGNIARTQEEAREKVDAAFASGAAAERFAKMVSLLGGPADLLEKPGKYLTLAPVRKDVWPDTPGFVGAVDTRAIGIGIVEMGGGRARPSDRVDHAVGLAGVLGIGSETGKGSAPLAIVHARDEAGAEKMADTVRRAVTVLPSAPKISPLVAERICR